MKGNMYNSERKLLLKVILTLLGSWIFAYLLSVIFNQIGLVLIHVIMGRTNNIIYLNPFESYTFIPYPLSEPYLWVIGSNFMNIICATTFFFLIWRKRNHYLLPLLMWAPTVFIVEGFLIIMQVSGVSYGYWTDVFQSGLHIGFGVIFAMFFLIIGFLMMYFVKLLVYDASKISRWQIFLINIMVFPVWFIPYAIYHNFQPGTIFIVNVTIIVSVFNTLVEKSFLPFLSGTLHIPTIPLKWSNVGSSLGCAVIIIMILIFTPFEPYTERAHLANTIILSFFLIVGLPLIIGFVYKKVKSSKKVSILKKEAKKIIPLQEKEEIIAPEEIRIEEEVIEEKFVSEEVPVEEEIIEEEVGVPEEIPIEEEVIKEEVSVPEEILMDAEVIEEEVVVPEEIPAEEEVIEEEIIAPEEIPIEEEIIEEEITTKAPMVIKSIIHVHTLKGHTLGVSSVAFSPNGKYIVSGSKDKTIKIWEMPSGKLIKNVLGHDKYITSIVVSPDSKYIISGSNDKTVKVWDLTSGELIKTLEGHSFYVLSVAISPDSNYVVSSSYDKEIKVWELTTGKLVRTIKGHKKEIGSIAISFDNKYIVSGSNDKTIKIWDLKSGELIRTITGNKKNITSVAFSPKGKYIISGSNDKSIKVWEVATGNLVRTLEGHTFYVLSVAISPDSNYVVSGSFDNEVKLWDFSAGTLVKTLAGHKKEVNSVAISPDNKYIISGSNDMTIMIWELE